MTKNATKATLTVLIIIGSTGWIAPLYACIQQLITWGQFEVEPRLFKHEVTINSFPFLNFSGGMLIIAITWLSIVCIGWSSTLTWYFLWNRQSKETK